MSIIGNVNVANTPITPKLGRPELINVGHMQIDKRTCRF